MTPKRAPSYFLAPWEPADASAIQALQRGEADAAQQKRALDWIIKTAAGTYNVSFQPGVPDATAFAEGRRFVGIEIVKLLHINPRAFVKEQNVSN
jgi:hypothetical protein